MAGEFYTLSLLKLYGLDAQLTFGNKKGGDVYVFGNDGKYALLEVKTTTHPDGKGVHQPGKWEKVAKESGKNIYYVLVECSFHDDTRQWCYDHVYLVHYTEFSDLRVKGAKEFKEEYLFHNKIDSLRNSLNKI